MFSLEQLEPRCKNCDVILDYGTNTQYSDEHNAHVCMMCGKVI